ncbi:MAG: polyprotein [Hangzhou lschnura senegalensis iflavirus 1]|nr:MAG: polyprotein [Hangzhou lschnura senegalensis iflavirus 1]
MATTKRTPTMRSGARRTAARHQPAIAPLVLKRTMREFPPLPKVTLFGDPIPAPTHLGDVHPDHSYALMALGMGASIPPPPSMPRVPLWHSVVRAPLALVGRRAFIGPRTRSWYLYRGLYHPQHRPTYSPPKVTKGLERPSQWRSYITARRPELLPHLPTRVVRIDLPSKAPLDGPLRFVKVWARPIAGVAHFNRLVQRVLLHHGAEWAARFQEAPLQAWEEYRAQRQAAQQAAASVTPSSRARPTSCRQVKKRHSPILPPLSQLRAETAPVEELPSRRQFVHPRSHFPCRTIAAYRQVLQALEDIFSPTQTLLPPTSNAEGKSRFPSVSKGSKEERRSILLPEGETELRARYRKLKCIQKRVTWSTTVRVQAQWQNNPTPAQTGLSRDVAPVEVDEASQAAIVAPPPDTQAVTIERGLDPSVLGESACSLPSVGAADSDKWISLSSIEWKTTHRQGDRLLNQDFPYVLMRLAPDHPAMTMFRKSYQWRGGLRFKLLITSGVYAQGELICAFLHELSTRRNYDRFLHSHSLSQIPHTILTAGGTRSIEIEVPYVNSRPYLPIVASNRSPPLNLGRFIVMVFNPLSAATSALSSATIQVFVKLENSEFCGTRNLTTLTLGEDWDENLSRNKKTIITFQGLLGDIISGGLRGAIRAGTQWLNADSNRDFPSAHAPPQPCLTIQTDSFALGQGISVARSLRLIPDVLSPHMIQQDDTSILSLARKFGRVSVIEWKSTADVGTTLWLKPSNFLWPLDCYDKLEQETTTPLYFVPPMGVVASCFTLARGSIEVKVRAVATSLHAGKLIIGYIPYRTQSPADVDNSTLLGGTYVTWDISETSELTFQVPYVRNELWTPQVYVSAGGSGNAYDPEGVVAINVFTPLVVSNDSVVNSVSINVFVRAGPDFEVAVPRIPTLLDLSVLEMQGDETSTGCSVETAHIPNVNVARITHGEVVRDFKDVFRRYSMLARFKIADAPDSTTISVPCSYTLPLHFLGSIASGDYDSWTENRVLNNSMKLICSAFRYRLGGMRLRFVFNNVKSGSSVYIQHVPLTLSKYKKISPADSLASDKVDYTNYLSSSLGVVYQKLSDNPVVEVEVPCYNTNQYCLMALDPNARQQEALNSDLGALRLFFPNRALVAGVSVHVYFAWADDTRVYHFQGFPAMATMSQSWVKPKPRTSRHSGDQVSPSTSKVPALEVSGKFIPPTPPTSDESSSNETIEEEELAVFDWKKVEVAPIDHVADTAYEVLHRYEFTDIIRNDVDAVMRLIHSYGLQVKRVVESRIDAHALLVYEAREKYTVGVLIELDRIMQTQARFGYKNYCDLSLYNPYALRLELFGPKYGNFTIREWAALASTDQAHRLKSNSVEWQGVFESAAQTCLTTAAATAGATGIWALSNCLPGTPASQFSALNDKLGNISEQVSVLQDKIDVELASFKEIMALVSKFVPAKELNRDRLVLSFIQLLTSSSGAAFGLNFVSLLVDVGLFDSSLTTWMTAGIGVILGRMYDRMVSPQQTTETRQVVCHQSGGTTWENDESFMEYLKRQLVDNFIFLILQRLGKSALPSNWIPNYACILSGIHAVSSLSRDLSAIQRFIKDNLEVLTRCWRWVVSKLYKVLGLSWAIRDLQTETRNWVREAYYLTEPGVSAQCLQNPALAYRVYVASMNFHRLISSEAGAGMLSKPAVMRVSTELRTLKEKLEKNKDVPPVRMEPFVIQIVGNTSCGKSSIAAELVNSLLKELYGNELPINHTYVREPTCEFWDGMPATNPKAIISDDFLAVTGDGMATKQIATMFSVKSCAIFMPPFAHLEEKGRRINPDLYLLLSNVAYPRLPGVSEMAALWRRRDLLIEQRFEGSHLGQTIGQYVTRLKQEQPTLDDVALRAHVNSRISFSLKDPLKDTQEAGIWYKWNEILPIIKKRFSEFRQLEELAYKRRLDLAFNRDLDQFMEVVPIEDPSTKDCLALYKQALQADMASSLTETRRLAKVKWNKLQKLEAENCPEFMLSALLALERSDSSLSLASENAPNLMDLVTKGAHRYHQRIATLELPRPAAEAVPVAESPTAMSEEDAEALIDLTPPTPPEPSSMPSSRSATVADWIEHFNLGPMIEICESIPTFKRTTLMQNDPPVVEEPSPPPVNTSSPVWSAAQIAAGKPRPGWETYCDLNKLSGCYHHLVTTRANYAHGYFYVCESSGGFSLYKISEYACDSGCYWEVPGTYEALVKSWTEMYAARYADDSTSPAMKPLFMREKRRSVQDAEQQLISAIRTEVSSTVRRTVPPSVLAVGKLFAGMLALTSALFCGALAFKFLKRYLPTRTVASANRAIDTSSRGVTRVEMVEDDSNSMVVSLLPQTVVASGDAIRQKKLRMQKKQIRVFNKSAKTENQSEVVRETPAEMRLAKNICFMVYKTPEGKLILSSRCLGVQERWVITTWHFVEQAEGLSMERSLFIEVGGVEIPLPREKLVAKQYGQLAVIRLPPAVPNFKKVTHFIASAKEHSLTSGGSAVLLEVCRTRTLSIWHGIEARAIEEAVSVGASGGCAEASIVNGYEYNVGRTGMCGSILWDTSIQNGKVLAMHVAGQPGARSGYSHYGVAALLVREEIEAFFGEMENYAVEASFESEMPFLSEEDPAFCADLNAELLGSLPKELVPQNPVETTIIPSVVAPYLPPPLTTPAPFLHNDVRFKEPRNPFVEGVEKHGGIPISWPQPLVERAYKVLLSRFLRCRPVIPLSGKLSLEQAIVGIPGIDEMSAIEMGTSPGFGWKHLQPKGEKGKRWLFELEETPQGNRLVSLNELLSEKIKHENELREQGEAPLTVFTDCLKDARIKHEKVHKVGCTRVFSLSPIQHTVACRQYTLEFVAAVMRNRIDNNVCVGINLNSLEATKLVNKHLKVSQYHLCGDYSAFGDTLDPTLVYYCFKIIVEWYRFHGDRNESHELARWALAVETGRAIHVARDFVYRVYSGLPSGSPLTVILNSMVNSFYMILSFGEITGKPLEEYPEYVAEDNYGDDVWLTVRESILPVFNNVSLHENFAKHGIRYTDALKTGNIREYCSLKDVTFLKCSFVPHPKRSGIYLAPLDWTSVEECAKWIHKCDDEKAAAVVNILAAQRLAFGHGPERFDKFTYQLEKAAIKAGLPRPTFLDWNTIDEQCFAE